MFSLCVGIFPVEADTYVNESQIPQQLPAVAQDRAPGSFAPYNGSDRSSQHIPPKFPPPMPFKPKYAGLIIISLAFIIMISCISFAGQGLIEYAQ